MRGLRLERPPRWGILTLVLLVIGNVALFTLINMRPAPADTYVARPAPAPATPPQPPAQPETVAEPAVLAVYGDGYASGNELGGLDAAGWPALVAEETGSRLMLRAVPRAGYASRGVSGEDFPDIVEGQPVADATVTVVSGSRNDADKDPEVVRANAERVLALVRQAAPETAIVVVGPAWTGGDAPAGVLAVRDVVEAAAEAAGATFLDPLADGWFTERSGLIATDGISPTDAGHAYLADLIAPVVAAASGAGGR